MKKEEYLNTLTEQIRCKKARNPIREEINSHIEDQMEDFLAEGMEREEAEAAAIREMGDPVLAGGELDRLHRPKIAWKLIVWITALSIIGFGVQALVHSQLEQGQSVSWYFSRRQIVFAVISFMVMMGVCLLDYSVIGCYARELTLLLTVGIMVGLLLFGAAANGRYWIYLFGFSFNVSLMALLFVPLYGGILYQYRGQGKLALFKSLLWMLPGLLITWRNLNLTTFVTLFLSLVIVLSIAIYKGWFQVPRKMILTVIWGCVLLLPILGIWAVMNNGAIYQQERLRAMLHLTDSLPTQVQFLKTLLSESQLLGRGYHELQAGEYMTDYILAYAVAYYGILVGILLVGLILLLFLRFYSISLRQKNQLGMLMGAGCSTVLFIQVILYLLGNLGILPAGVYCPFLTVGGSGMVVSFCLFGLLLSIYRYEDVLPEPSKKRKGKIMVKAE